MNQAERWLSICFQKNINNVQAKLIEYNDKWYMFTRRTPEGCDFLYYLESVERWFNKIDTKSNIDIYQNFCDLVYPIDSPLELIKYFNEKFQLNLCSAECKEIIGMAYCITCERFICIDRRLNIDVVLCGKRVYCKECYENKKHEYSFLKPGEERIGEYRNRTTAAKAARWASRTGIKHRIVLTTTYRNLVPRLCWTIVLGKPGLGDKFQG